MSSTLTGIAVSWNDMLTFEEGKVKLNEKISDKKVYYIPINHSNLENQLNPDDVINSLRPIFESDNIKKITYDSKTAYNVLKICGIELKGIKFDVILASYVKNPARNHELAVQALEHLNHVISEYAPLKKTRKNK